MHPFWFLAFSPASAVFEHTIFSSGRPGLCLWYIVDMCTNFNSMIALSNAKSFLSKHVITDYYRDTLKQIYIVSFSEKESFN